MRRLGKRIVAITLAAAMMTSLTPQGMTFLQQEIVYAAEAESIQVSAGYQFDATNEWDTNKGKENNLSLTTDSVPSVGTKLEMDVLISGENAQTFSGLIKPVGVLRIGSDWNWVQSRDIPELKPSNFSETVTIDNVTYRKASVSIEFEETVDAHYGTWTGNNPFDQVVTDKVKGVTVQFAGWKCDYSGIIAIANARLVEPEAGATETVLKEWNFDDGIGSWEYATGWDGSYTGDKTNVTVGAEYGMLKVGVDYSAGVDNSWNQMAVREWANIGVKGTSKTTFDLYYNPKQLTKGAIAIKESLQYQDGDEYPEAVSTDVTVDTSLAVDADVEGLTGWKKVPVTITYDEVDKDICNTVLCIVGKNTTYSGALYIDNLKMIKSAPAEDIYVDSKKSPDTNAISVSNNKLNTYKKNKSPISTPIATKIKLVDKDATANTKAIYAYLEAVGKSESVIFGHQNDTWHKAGSSKLSNSDTTDVVGSISGVVGIDTLSLTGNEYSASRYNTEFTPEDTLPETPAGNVKAAANLTNYNIKQGAIITLSAHMPNFSQVKERDDYTEGKDPTYAKYDFSGYTPNVIKGDVMNEILPGGKYNNQYNAYLDMIADYASQVNGTILFRPFHENTGSWFWWGKAYCDAATYKNVYKYTVEYLRDTKNVHNMLYVYGPGSEAASVEEYGERYPGDEYVDMVGFDMYHSAPTKDDTWFDSLKAELEIVDNFATEHKKLIAVTETGVSNSADKGDKQTALHKTGNEQKDWYNTMLDAVSGSNASYFLLWANFGKKDGFYTPYVESVNEDKTLHGHEMMDNFISFYNDPRSLFANEQKDALSEINKISITATEVSTEATGYITAPVSGKRILDATTLTANASKVGKKTVKFVCENGTKKVELTAAGNEGAYSAQLDKTSLASLGEGVGTIKLYADGTKLDSIKAIFNMPEPKKDPYEIDGFENYFGETSLLQKDWATNKDSGCTIDISLTNEDGKHCDGDYGLKFTYNEKVGGWAGATIAKEVDWSECNALSLWTIPDGKNQKTVIQITAGGKEYEVYLNEYAEYQNVTTPLYVTIPFSAFKDRDGDGPEGGLTELKSKIGSVGLWVNQIGDEAVEGTIYYDKITAVSTNKTAVTFSSTDGSDSNGSNNSSGSTDSGNTVVTNPDGSTSTTTTTTKPDGSTVETVTTTKPDGTSTIVVNEQEKNEAGKTVEVETTTEKDAEGNVTGTTEKSVIADAAKNTSATVTVTTDSNNNVTATAEVTKEGIKVPSGTRGTIAASVIAQITEAAGTTDVTITQTVTDSKGKELYTVTMNASDAKAGTSLTIVKLDEKTGEYVLVNKKEYPVTKAGNVVMTIKNSGDYMLISKADATALTKKILKTVKPAASSKTVKKGKSTTFTFSKSLNMKNVAKITYVSSNSSVAKVSKTGKITAKKVGTVTIKVKVTLKDGSTKTVSMKIKVK